MTVRSASQDAPAHLAVLGDLILDVVIHHDRVIERGSDVAGSVRFRAGGSAANTARAFARLGGRATYIGAVGRDEWGRRLVGSLRADGVSVRVVRVDAQTARIAALVGPDGERSFVTERGAADRLAESDIRSTWLSAVDALHLPGYSLFHDPLAAAAKAAAALVRQRGGLVSVDLASRWPLLALGRRRAREVVASVEPTIVFANRDEAAALFRKRTAARLLELAPVVVIKGRSGCLVVARRAAGTEAAAGTGHGAEEAADPLRATVGAKRLPSPDTTGAGDAFAAGFLFAIITRRGGWPSALRSVAALERAAEQGLRAAQAVLTAPRVELADR